MNKEGSGYLQDKFSIRCGRYCCNTIGITKATLALRKFAEDLARDDTTLRSYLAWVFITITTSLLVKDSTTFPSGTLHTAKLDMDILRAKYIKDTVISILEFNRPDNATEEHWIVSIMENVSYSPEIMKQRIVNKIRMEGGKAYGCYFLRPCHTNSTASRMQSVFSAYEDDRMFSVELIGAVRSSHSAS
jgi:hypothetical protein